MGGRAYAGKRGGITWLGWWSVRLCVGAQWGEWPVGFDGDPLECAVGVDGVAPEPPPCIAAGADDPGLIRGEHSTFAARQSGDEEARRLARGGVPYACCAVLRSCEDMGVVGGPWIVPGLLRVGYAVVGGVVMWLWL